MIVLCSGNVDLSIVPCGCPVGKPVVGKICQAAPTLCSASQFVFNGACKDCTAPVNGVTPVCDGVSMRCFSDSAQKSLVFFDAAAGECKACGTGVICDGSALTFCGAAAVGTQGCVCLTNQHVLNGKCAACENGICDGTTIVCNLAF